MRLRAAHLIGRAAEVTELGELLGDLERSRGATAFLVGEGGIGKSRLVAELIGSALDAGPDHAIAQFKDPEIPGAG
ncbi:ATP-binding protein, partial [Streptomyces sp. NPDC051132]|uniref:ATP-binding protein n=1 Tax=Streptomyces sp. NPDC051132 TaxID=3155667 RepID=UPI0034215501